MSYLHAYSLATVAVAADGTIQKLVGGVGRSLQVDYRCDKSSNSPNLWMLSMVHSVVASKRNPRFLNRMYLSSECQQYHTERIHCAQ